MNRHKPLTDPHCSCDGETMSVRRVAGHQAGQAPTAKGTNLQLWGEDRIEHRLLEAWGPQHEDILQYVEDQATVWPGADQPGL